MRKALRSFVAVVAVLVMGLPTAGPATVRAQGSAKLDLAALAVSPADTRTAYLVLDGRTCLTVAACADPAFFAGLTEESLDDAGLVQAYALALAEPVADGSGAARSLATTIAEYDNRPGAEDGLPTFLAWLADPAASRPVESEIGDQAEVFVIEGPVVGDPNSTGGVGLRFRSGSIVVGIEIREYSGAALDQAAVERLGRIVARRISDGQDSPGLGALVVHHRATTNDLYAHQASVTTPLWGERSDAYMVRSAEFAEAGVEDVFLSRQILVAGDNPQSPEVVLAIALYRLSTSTAASAYLADASTTFTIGWEQNDLAYTEPDEPAFIGDESIWYLNVFESGYQVVAFVRQGDIVARIIWQRNDANQQDAAADLLTTAETDLLPGAEYTADQQITCLDEGSCPGVTRLSSRLLP